VFGLREQGHDCDAGVAANDDNLLVCGVGAFDLGDKTGSTDDVKSCDTEETFGVIDTLGFEDLGDNWNG
jgi:hypothetical protein